MRLGPIPMCAGQAHTLMSKINMHHKTIKIKSLSQPNGGEGTSEGQVVVSNGAGEGSLIAKVRGYEQEPSKASHNRDESATQDEVLYPLHGETRRLGASARKECVITPGGPWRLHHYERKPTGANGSPVDQGTQGRGGLMSPPHAMNIDMNVHSGSSERTARSAHRVMGVSRRHSSCRRTKTGVAADGSPVQRRVGKTYPSEGLNGARPHHRRVNESGQ